MTELERLEKRQQKIQERIRTLKNREKAKARKLDTRRKIIAGAILLKKIETGDFPVEQFRQWIDCEITRSQDLSLFKGIRELKATK